MKPEVQALMQKARGIVPSVAAARIAEPPEFNSCG